MTYKISDYSWYKISARNTRADIGYLPINTVFGIIVEGNKTLFAKKENIENPSRLTERDILLLARNAARIGGGPHLLGQSAFRLTLRNAVTVASNSPEIVNRQKPFVYTDNDREGWELLAQWLNKHSGCRLHPEDIICAFIVQSKGSKGLPRQFLQSAKIARDECRRIFGDVPNLFVKEGFLFLLKNALLRVKTGVNIRSLPAGISYHNQKWWWNGKSYIATM